MSTNKMPHLFQLSCKCLNVILHIDGFQPLDRSALLREEETLSQHAFFNQEFGQVQRVVKVTRALPNLVHVRQIGSANIEQCLNCSVNTHALLNREHADLWLVNANLLPSSAIEDLKKHANFSKIYQVIIFHTDDDKEVRFDYLPADTEKSIRALKQKADDCINSESQLTEERIRIFTDKEFHLFNDYKDRVRAENKALARIIIKQQQREGHNGDGSRLSTIHNSSSMELKQQENLKASALRKVPDAFEPIVKIPSPQAILDDSLSASPRQHVALQKTDSLDSQCLFELDGMNDMQSLEHSEDSDNEEFGMPIRQTARGRQSFGIAKSLPMNIPVYMSLALKSHRDDDTDEETTVQAENTQDIAASMQALARSVNGDAVFGDLPRTRCRTFI